MNALNMITANARPVDLSSRAMLVNVSIRQWTARKLDKRVTADVNASHGAGADAGRYNKSLIARDALAEIKTIVSAARADHVKLTLPWLQDGTRILPSAGFQTYSDTMRTHRESFEQAVSEFVAAYPQYVDEARAYLNGMFDESEYPSPDEIAGRFGWSLRVFPMPDAADFRVDLADDTVDAMRQEIADTMSDAVADAMSDAFDRLHKAVRHMADKLREFTPKQGDSRASGVFRDSLVENVRELVAILPGLNLTGDARLSEAIAKTEAKLTTYDAKELRENDAARDEVAQAADAIADDLAAFMGA